MTALAGKTYAVTGASKGFGRAIAEALLRAGVKVGLLSEEVMGEATRASGQ